MKWHFSCLAFFKLRTLVVNFKESQGAERSHHLMKQNLQHLHYFFFYFFFYFLSSLFLLSFSGWWWHLTCHFPPLLLFPHPRGRFPTSLRWWVTARCRMTTVKTGVPRSWEGALLRSATRSTTPTWPSATPRADSRYVRATIPTVPVSVRRKLLQN